MFKTSKAVQAAGGQWPDIKQQTQAKVVKSTADDSQVLATPVASFSKTMGY